VRLPADRADQSVEGCRGAVLEVGGFETLSRVARPERLGVADHGEGVLIQAGPPFPEARGAASSKFGFRVAYASWTEVVFVFEGDEVEWIVTEIVNEPSGAVAEAPGRGAGSSRIRHASRGPSIPGKATRTSQRAVSGRDGQQICDMA
jgi:hypothetical protein